MSEVVNVRLISATSRKLRGQQSSCSSSIGMCSVSRKFLRSSTVSFFIWWVALRPSKWLPSVQPLIVLASTTVGWPLCCVAAA